MKQTTEKVSYTLGRSGEFIIENYNCAKPFASFFPGIAGPHGIPMWVFYVNRAQCVCSIGIEDKEHPIMEFLSANGAYQLTSTQGFRTFVKIGGGAKPRFYEPFQRHAVDAGMDLTQKMIIFPAQPCPSYADQVLGAFQDRGLQPARLLEVRELQAALGLVAAGEGITVVPRSIHGLQHSDVRYLALNEADLYSAIVLSVRRLDHSADLRNLLELIYRIYEEEDIPHQREAL